MELSKSIEFFYKNLIDTSSDDESGGDLELLMVVAQRDAEACAHGLDEATMGNVN
jgi:hypothetical protein